MFAGESDGRVCCPGSGTRCVNRGIPGFHEQNYGEHSQCDSENDRNDLQDDWGESGTAEADNGGNSATPESRIRSAFHRRLWMLLLLDIFVRLPEHTVS
jgi:hypothetical protein